MRFLVLNRNSLVERDYATWIGDAHQVTLLTAESVLPSEPRERKELLDRYNHVETFEDFHANPAVELRALELHRTEPFDRIIGITEYDIIRVARLRERLGIPGQGVTSALHFRDKLRMKDALAAAGVPIPAYAEVENVFDIVDFIEEHGYPIVVKPRSEGGSAGVVVLRDALDLQCYAATATGLGSDGPASLMAEAYVEHQMLHVDGLVVDGEVQIIWPSTHGETGCLDPMAGKPLISSMLQEDEDDFAPAVDLTRRALEALTTPETFIFHAELFRQHDGRMVFNEVACRTSGLLLDSNMGIAFGSRLSEAYVRTVAENDPPRFSAMPAAPYGYASVPPVSGRVAAVPGDCPIDGIVDHTSHAAVGNVLSTAKTSIDTIATFVATGEARAQVVARLEEAIQWYQGGLRMEPLAE